MDPITLVSSAARTSNSQSNWYDLSRYEEGLILAKVTASSGTTPAFQIIVEGSNDEGSTKTAFVLTKSQKLFGTVNPDPIVVTNFGKWLRIKWILSGTTPSYTFSVTFIGKSN